MSSRALVDGCLCIRRNKSSVIIGGWWVVTTKATNTPLIWSQTLYTASSCIQLQEMISCHSSWCVFVCLLCLHMLVVPSRLCGTDPFSSTFSFDLIWFCLPQQNYSSEADERLILSFTGLCFSFYCQILTEDDISTWLINTALANRLLQILILRLQQLRCDI